MQLKGFDFKQFIIQRGERVALGAALTLMSLLIISSGLSAALKQRSASSNTKAITDLIAEARTKITSSTPPANLGELPEDLKEVETVVLDRDSIETQNLFFDHNKYADR